MLKQTVNLPIENGAIRKLSKLSPMRSLIAILTEWLFIIGAIGLHIYFPHPATYFVVWLIIGSRMYALYSLLHDGIHYLLFPKKQVNDLLSRLFLSGPLFISLSKMRKFHLAHHQHLQTSEDPESVHLQYHEFQFPQSAGTLIFTFLKDITGVNFLVYKTRKILDWTTRILRREEVAKEVTANQFVPFEPGMIIYYVALAVCVIYMSWEVKFILYWIVPYITIYQALNRLRLSTEHFHIEEQKIFQTRTVKLNFIEQFFFSPHNLGFHTEHHLYPSVPFYRLPVLHQMLMRTSAFRENVLVGKSYFAVIKKYIK